jgi:ketosteroid isomerase-like protein
VALAGNLVAAKRKIKSRTLGLVRAIPFIIVHHGYATIDGECLGGRIMRRMQFVVFVACLYALTSLVLGQEKASPKAKSGAEVDKSYLQKIWDGWSTLNPENVAQFYAKGPHVFFDITPVKYESWEEYRAGVVKVLSGFESAKCTVNDDAEIHRAGSDVWITATVAADMVEKSGKHDPSTFRWTAVFERTGGKWLIVHEHVSEPLSQ